MTERRPKTVACIGGGVIGAGWAARLALAGVDVVVSDPAPATERIVAVALAAARRAWRKLTLSPPAVEGSVRFVADIAEAAAAADYAQESVPEREDIKRAVLARLDEAMPPSAIIASSTSGLSPSRLQAGMRHPQRFCVVHPFNPVYLLPLAEICGGEQTAATTTSRAAAFCREVGMTPLTLRAEIDGFIADRLMEALWREALWLVNDDVATAAEIDDAVRFGCGLRWAFMGPFLTYRLAGGEGGMRHFMAQFGPTLKLPWTKLTDAPELDDVLLDKITAQSDAQAEGASVADLVDKRDDCLVAVLQGLRGVDFAAGKALRNYEDRRYGRAHHLRLGDSDDIPAPLVLHQARATAEWIDYNGHMTESRYLQVFGDATDALLHFIGVDAEYVAGGNSYHTAETHLRHLAPAHVDDALTAETQALAVDEKRLRIFHTLRRGDAVIARAEHMLLHVRDGRAAAAAPAVLARARRVVTAHRGLPPPPDVGRGIAMRS